MLVHITATATCMPLAVTLVSYGVRISEEKGRELLVYAALHLLLWIAIGLAPTALSLAGVSLLVDARQSGFLFLIAIANIILAVSYANVAGLSLSLGLSGKKQLLAPFIVCAFILPIILFSQGPISAWDSLDYWAIEAARYLDVAGREEPMRPFATSYIHPHTGIGLLVSSVILGTGLESSSWRFTPVVPQLTTMLILCRALGAAAKVELKLNSLIAVAILSVPLVMNHLALVGYVDLWMALNVAVSASLIGFFFLYQSPSLIFFGLISLLSLAAWRNNWLVYFAPVFLSGLIAGLWIFGINSFRAKEGKLYWVLLALGLSMVAIAVVWLCNNTFDVPGYGTFGVQRFPELTRIWVGFRYFPLEFQEVAVVFDAFAFSLLTNMSFSVFPLIFAFLSIATLMRCPWHGGALFFFLVPLLLVATFIVATMISTFFFINYAAVGSDTGLSRFMLAWLLSCLPLLFNVMGTEGLVRLRPNP